ncbi:MAG: hypothetical protein J6X10_01780 [Bacteroidales bacterium]|nr:hypothetical protein [Bacteroidales bacterium]
MNIEEKIRNNREAFDDMKMPEGSRERFEARLAGKKTIDRRIWLTFTSIAAAAVALLLVVLGLNYHDNTTPQVPQVADSKLIDMRNMYDQRVEEAIINLENVMENVDDTTRMQINAVIHDLMNMGDVFAEMAPLPEDRQMAIAEQIYDNKLRAIELITEKVNK